MECEQKASSKLALSCRSSFLAFIFYFFFLHKISGATDQSHILERKKKEPFLVEQSCATLLSSSNIDSSGCPEAAVLKSKYLT